MGYVFVVCLIMIAIGACCKPLEEDPAKRPVSEKLGRSLGKAARKVIDYGNDT